MPSGHHHPTRRFPPLDRGARPTIAVRATAPPPYAAAMAGQEGTAGAQDAVAALADEYWQAWLAAHPRGATIIGDHRFDDRIEDLTAGAEEAERGRAVDLLG